MGAGPGDRAVDNLHATAFHVPHRAGQAEWRDKTQVCGTRSCMSRFRLELMPHLMEIDFLITEFQGDAAFAEMNRLHAQHLLVELQGFVDIPDGQHEMIKTAYIHGVLEVIDPAPLEPSLPNDLILA